MRNHARVLGAVVAAAVLAVPLAAQPGMALVITDFLTVPMTGSPTADGNPGSLARVSMMREEPGGTGRLFVNDLNGPLYIVDKKTHSLAPYLDFNGRDGKPGLFERLPYAAGYQNGFVAFVFDPDYARNGVFYTLHMEEPGAAGSALPNNRSFPGLTLAGYTPSAAVRTPGEIQRESVLIEWTDSNIRNTTFEGTAREVLRVALNTRIHPCGDLIFNPTAHPGDPDWRTLYISCGDGGSGEQMSAVRQHPQRLDTLVGKILRIVPDLSLDTQTTIVSENGRYRIPRDNPFVNVQGARPEIWAYGFRNPHRLTWDVDPASGADHLIAANIGLSTWETIDIVHRGANYGYPAREGTELLRADNKTGPLPSRDEIPIQISDSQRNGTVVPRYPVIEFPHTQEGGDAISGGFVYRGALLRALDGQYVFGDITTGKIWFADLKEMLAADDTNPATLARLHPLQVRWDGPGNAPDRSPHLFPTMFQVVLAGYKARGGIDPDLPGRSTVSGPGRADIRFAVDAASELYILSKADGMIRAVTGVTALAEPARN
jgi:hypothetical protein